MNLDGLLPLPDEDGPRLRLTQRARRLVHVALALDLHAAAIRRARTRDELNAAVAFALAQTVTDADDVTGETDTYVRRESEDEARGWDRLGDAWHNAMIGLQRFDARKVVATAGPSDVDADGREVTP